MLWRSSQVKIIFARRPIPQSHLRIFDGHIDQHFAQIKTSAD
jgi:hypothetical protein